MLATASLKTFCTLFLSALLIACSAVPANLSSSGSDADRAAKTLTPVVLSGTRWQLLRFQGGDGRTLVPDKASYIIDFQSDGRVNVRFDCNRGSGTWKSSDPSGLQFGPLALTRAMCPEPALHDRLVKDWTFVRSFVISNGHLFLSLMADGGIYEFAPAPA
ncbi:META domain-containing protein [Noviherbaspirillum saxi]|nr:META domain-containing protein [Noviherbaspirillum saxi]